MSIKDGRMATMADNALLWRWRFPIWRHWVFAVERKMHVGMLALWRSSQ